MRAAMPIARCKAKISDHIRCTVVTWLGSSCWPFHALDFRSHTLIAVLRVVAMVQRGTSEIREPESYHQRGRIVAEEDCIVELAHSKIEAGLHLRNGAHNLEMICVHVELVARADIIHCAI